jgi:hypothetical protein
MTLASTLDTATSTRASAPEVLAPSTAAKWTARVLAGLAVALLTFDTALKVFQLAPAVESAAELGFPTSAFLWIGVFEVACLALYLVPRTAPLGAILWTGFLGGAIATHVRLENPLFSHTLFPIYVAILLWLPLWLRDARVRSLLGPVAR